MCHSLICFQLSFFNIRGNKRLSMSCILNGLKRFLKASIIDFKFYSILLISVGLWSRCLFPSFTFSKSANENVTLINWVLSCIVLSKLWYASILSQNPFIPTPIPPPRYFSCLIKVSSCLE